MASGLGPVDLNDIETRYNRNGHFDVSTKHWFGWIEDEQVVFMHPDGSRAVGCPHCVSSWAGKINAFDRPDVVPGLTAASSGSEVFAVKVHYTVPYFYDLEMQRENDARDNVIYVYYRTAYPGRRAGVAVQYCTRIFDAGWDAGFASTCYGYDVNGDSYTMDDSVIVPGTTFVATPSYQAVQALGYRRAYRVLPRIRVDSVSLFNDCTNMICPENKDISASVSIDFVSPEDADAAVTPALRVSPEAPVSATRELQFQGGKVDVLFDDFKNDKGVATITLTACPAGGMEAISMLVYDLPPLSSLLPGQSSVPSGYNANLLRTVLADDCCSPGDMMDVLGMKAVVVRAMGSTSPLNIAEIRIMVGGKDVTSSARCFSFPTTGYWWNGADRSTGSQPNLNDGDSTTYSHAGDQVATGNYDMCVLTSRGQIERVEVLPRQDGAFYRNRAADTNVEIYAGLSVDVASQQYRPIGLLHEERFTHAEWSEWVMNTANIPDLSTLPSTFACASQGPFQLTYTAVQGSAYVRIETMLYPDSNRPTTGAISLKEATFNILQCPSGSYLKGASCVPCEKGKYSDFLKDSPSFPASYTNGGATSADSCTSCPSGKFSSLTGASSASDCFAASARHCRDQGLCKCPAGYISEQDGGPCRAFDTRDSPSAVEGLCDVLGDDVASCVPCEAGKYRGEITAEETRVVWGSWNCENIAGMSCSDPDNCYCSFYEKSELAGCLDCPAGKFSGTSGASACETCLLGKFSSQSGVSSCDDCPSGTYLGYEQREDFLWNEECTAVGLDGNEGPGKGYCFCDESCWLLRKILMQECADCASAKYSACPGATACADCPLGSESTTAGSSTCTPCEAGKYKGYKPTTETLWSRTPNLSPSHYHSQDSCLQHLVLYRRFALEI